MYLKNKKNTGKLKERKEAKKYLRKFKKEKRKLKKTKHNNIKNIELIFPTFDEEYKFNKERIATLKRNLMHFAYFASNGAFVTDKEFNDQVHMIEREENDLFRDKFIKRTPELKSLLGNYLIFKENLVKFYNAKYPNN